VGWLSVLRRALCLQDTVISSFAWCNDILIVTVRPRKRDRNRCSRCQRRSPYYDALTEGRRWRSVDLGSIRVYLEADTHRVRCPDHGVVVAHVPWARASSRMTLAFEDLASWFAAQCNQTVVAEYLRTTWRSVGAAIRRRVMQTDWPLHTEHLERIGIDEISYRKGHRYLTIVVNHDTGRLIWAAPGRSKEVVHAFFDELGPGRCELIKLVTRDAATWVSTVVEEKCPNAEQCMDPFHVVKWATDAVDEVRRETWHALEYWSCPGAARFIKGALWILRMNRPHLTKKQLRGLAIIQRDNKYLYPPTTIRIDHRVASRVNVTLAENMPHVECNREDAASARRDQVAIGYRCAGAQLHAVQCG